MANRWQLIDRGNRALLDHLCALRGFNPAGLEPDFVADLHDPQLLPGISEARKIIRQAVKDKWPTVIFGDYDADGTPAAALLSHVFTRLGVPHQAILPTRQEGYGLRLETIDRLPTATKLLVTVDTGISSVEEIARAKKQGMAVIVVDHHLPGPVLPKADALIDPFVPGSRYPFSGLCGCALAYKLTEALAVDFPAELNEAFRKWLLDLVAISTVADMMSLRDENRALVHYGLKVLKKTRRAGLKALLEAAGLSSDKITASSLGFTIGPRLNASGRLGDNLPALKLLITEDPTEAAQLAAEIEANNSQRQRTVSEVLEEVTKVLFTQNAKTDHCFVVHGALWPAGVVGLVAGKLTGQYHRPVVVLTGDQGTLTGSARSTGAYSIIDGLTANADWLTRFGGHHQAAGMSLEARQLPNFVDGLKAHAKSQIPPADLEPTYTAEASLSDDELTLETASQLATLAPFGQENPPPLLLVRNVRLGPARTLGASGDHLKWQTGRGSSQFEVIGFGIGKRQKEVPEIADLLGHLEVNEWRDRRSLQLRLVDFRPSEDEIELIYATRQKSVRL